MAETQLQTQISMSRLSTNSTFAQMTCNDELDEMERETYGGPIDTQQSLPSRSISTRDVRIHAGTRAKKREKGKDISRRYECWLNSIFWMIFIALVVVGVYCASSVAELDWATVWFRVGGFIADLPIIVSCLALLTIFKDFFNEASTWRFIKSDEYWATWCFPLTRWALRSLQYLQKKPFKRCFNKQNTRKGTTWMQILMRIYATWVIGLVFIVNCVCHCGGGKWDNLDCGDMKLKMGSLDCGHMARVKTLALELTGFIELILALCLSMSHDLKPTHSSE